MREKAYVMAVDQGTTSSRAIIFDKNGKQVGMGQKEFPQIYPKPGYVEHNAVQILNSQIKAMKQAFLVSGIHEEEIAAIGITNQRETTVAWDSRTGLPIYNAIVWQCRRTSDICEKIKEDGLCDYIKSTTGLIVDPYFSGTKMKWILDNVTGARELADEGYLRMGTIDSWLIYSFSEGKTFVTDYSNASRTMLFDINNLKWDEKLLNYFGIPKSALAEVIPSSKLCGYLGDSLFGTEIPISGIAGDQPAALFGQCCFEKGMVKNTYGTGCFTLMNTGEKPVHTNNLLTTIGWGLNGKITYALEGSAFNAGSAIQWLRDELKIISKASEADELAESIENTGGVCFVPAFTGLGAPHWDMYARGVLMGLTRGTGRAEISRAVLESIAFESYDLFKTMEEDSGIKIKELRVDGGASRSRFLMQYQCDLIGTPVKRPVCLETTALGAALLAGLGVGFWSEDDIQNLWECDVLYTPNENGEENQISLKRWNKAVNASKNWIVD